MKPLRMIIADDNDDALEIVKGYIGNSPRYRILDTCRDGEELVEQVAIHRPDVVLLDINMPRANGIDTMKRCMRIRPAVEFVFITSYDEYAVEAYELGVLDYVVKPYDKTRLITALERARDKVGSRKETVKRLQLRNGSSTHLVDLDEIIFIEKVDKKCVIYTEHGTYRSHEKIGSFKLMLEPYDFFMTHRSYIVNLKKVSRIVSKNETYLVYFHHIDKHAHLSKLKYEEFHSKFL